MRLVVKKTGNFVDELNFSRGPIYIGRHSNSQVPLPVLAVSRQHAVIYTTHEGEWVVEDLDSANKTYLNGDSIHKAPIKSGDVLGIADFTIEIDMDENGVEAGAIHLDDTMALPTGKMQIIVRQPGAEHAPAMKLPARRAKDFVTATEAICRARGLEKVVQALLHIAGSQFLAFHCWCALRNQPEGPMVCHAGKKRGGQSVEIGDIKLNEKINEAAEKGQFLLLPRMPIERIGEQIQSILIAPIVSQTGCFGVIYIDNAPDHERYSLSDLDYLMLLAIHTATVIENF